MTNDITSYLQLSHENLAQFHKRYERFFLSSAVEIPGYKKSEPYQSYYVLKRLRAHIALSFIHYNSI